MKELQTNWDKLVKKLGTVKVHLETNLLQWADYNSSYSQLEELIKDREGKLKEIYVQKCESRSKSRNRCLSIDDKKATLRRTNNIVQDIESLEHMIQSVTSKAEDLKQVVPVSDISTKYESLSKKAKELYKKQKDTIESHQAFIDFGNGFIQWLDEAKYRLNTCMDSVFDKSALSNKFSQLHTLINEIPNGENKLKELTDLAEKAKLVGDLDDHEIIEEETLLLQNEFDTYRFVFF